MRHSKGTVLAKAKVRYNAFVVLEQDLELMEKAIPSEFDGLATFFASIGAALLIALLTCDIPEYMQGVFGTIAVVSGVAAVVRFWVVRRKRSSSIDRADQG